jgi:hypothetical protein
VGGDGDNWMMRAQKSNIVVMVMIIALTANNYDLNYAAAVNSCTRQIFFSHFLHALLAQFQHWHQQLVSSKCSDSINY